MKTEGCRSWRTALGAHALGQLPPEERAGLEAHLEGCADCRAEARSLEGVARLLPYADPARFGTTPAPPAALGERVTTLIGEGRRGQQRRRRRFGLAFGGAAAALAAVAAILFLPSGGEEAPQRHVSFTGLPSDMHIGATLIPHSYGTEIHMYVKGVESGTLCRVFLRGPRGARYEAGTFRYRWGEDSDAVLTAALDLSRTRAIGVEAGGRTFVAPVTRPMAAASAAPATAGWSAGIQQREEKKET